MKEAPNISKDLDARQRIFAQMIAEGSSQLAAYRNAFGKGDRSQASKLAAKPLVQDEILRLRQSVEEEANMSCDEIVQKLSAIIRSKPSEASLDNPLCVVRMSKAGPYATFPDKTRCIERLAKMLGWDSPEQRHHTATIHVAVGGDT